MQSNCEVNSLPSASFTSSYERVQAEHLLGAQQARGKFRGSLSQELNLLPGQLTRQHSLSRFQAVFSLIRVDFWDCDDGRRWGV